MQTRAAQRIAEATCRTSSPTPPPILPILPNEILLKIIQHFTEDKDTLSRFMRVSPTFNSVAAPLLYRSVVLNGSTGLFDHNYPQLNRNPKSRISPHKDQLLDYIEDVNFKMHINHLCSDAQCTRRMLNVSLLQISADVADFPWECCKCLRGIAPRKLVFHNRITSIVPFAQVNPAIDKTVVTTHHIFQNKRHDVLDLLRYAPQSGLMVFIFWSPPSDANELSELRVKLWKEVQEYLVDGAEMNRYPQEMVFVNIEGIAAAEIGNLAGTKTLCEYAAQVNLEQYLKNLDKHPGPHRAHYYGCCDKMERARNTKLKFTFVTMRDYLKNWDWEGELTDEEVRPWLESQESVDEALESELEVEVGGE